MVTVSCRNSPRVCAAHLSLVTLTMTQTYLLCRQVLLLLSAISRAPTQQSKTTELVLSRRPQSSPPFMSQPPHSCNRPAHPPCQAGRTCLCRFIFSPASTVSAICIAISTQLSKSNSNPVPSRHARGEQLRSRVLAARCARTALAPPHLSCKSHVNFARFLHSRARSRHRGCVHTAIAAACHAQHGG